MVSIFLSTTLLSFKSTSNGGFNQYLLLMDYSQWLKSHSTRVSLQPLPKESGCPFPMGSHPTTCRLLRHSGQSGFCVRSVLGSPWVMMNNFNVISQSKPEPHFWITEHIADWAFFISSVPAKHPGRRRASQPPTGACRAKWDKQGSYSNNIKY